METIERSFRPQNTVDPRWSVIALFLLVTAAGPTAFAQMDPLNSGMPGYQGAAFDSSQTTDPAQVPPELKAQREMLRNQQLGLANQRLALGNATMAMENERYKMGSTWLARELGEQGREYMNRQADERKARQLRDHLAKQRNALLRLGNGRPNLNGCSPIKESLSTVPLSTELAYLLQAGVPPFSAADFETNHAGLSLLARDGSLERPPAIPAGTTVNAQLVRLEKAITQTWQDCLSDVTRQRAASSARVAAFRTALQQYEEAWTKSSTNTSSLYRVRTKQYVQAVRSLADLLEDPRKTERLRRYVDGVGFPGGSVGALVEWLAAMNVTPRLGTRGYSVLTEVSRLLVVETDIKLAAIDRRLEELRGQNPQHNMVLRQRMLGNPEGSVIKGSGSYGTAMSGWGTSDVLVPPDQSGPRLPASQPGPGLVPADRPVRDEGSRDAIAELHDRLPFLSHPPGYRGAANLARATAANEGAGQPRGSASNGSPDPSAVLVNYQPKPRGAVPVAPRAADQGLQGRSTPSPKAPANGSFPVW